MFSNGIACNLPFSCMNVTRDSGSDELLPNKMAREPVLLNVYDMYKVNEYTANIGLGVFHSGKMLDCKVQVVYVHSNFRCRNIWNRVCLWWPSVSIHRHIRNRPQR